MPKRIRRDGGRYRPSRAEFRSLVQAGTVILPGAYDALSARLIESAGSRTDPDLLVVARTDALTVHGVDDAIDRAKAFGSMVTFDGVTELLGLDRMRDLETRFRTP